MDQAIIDRLFKRLQAAFPKWREVWQSDGELKAAKKQWTRAIVKQGLADPHMLKLGVEKAESIGWVRPPSPAQFCQWCVDGAKEKAAIPSKEDARTEVLKVARLGSYRRKKTVMSPPIYQMCRFIDWYDFQMMNMEQATKAIDRAYDQMVDHWKAGRPFAEQPVLIERNPSGVVHKRATKEQAREILGKLKEDLQK